MVIIYIYIYVHSIYIYIYPQVKLVAQKWELQKRNGAANAKTGVCLKMGYIPK